MRKNIILRKMLASIISTALISICLAYYAVLEPDVMYDLGNQLMAWSMVYGMYVGAIIILFGNAVSLTLEYVQRKRQKQHHGLYLLLHGLFGLANGLFFWEWRTAIPGMVAALLYAIIDRGLYRRFAQEKRVTLYILTPVLVYLLAWGYFQYTSPQEPAFTKADAVSMATDGDGAVENNFPAEIGKWRGTIEGYEVERETNVSSNGDENYIVTFTETWKKGTESGSWSLSYIVDRNSLTANGNIGEMPPYY